MILTLNKRTLLEDGKSSEPMTDSPDNSEGETIAQKLTKNMKFTGVLNKGQIDELEANRRAILAVTKRRFADEEVEEDNWNKNIDRVI